MVMRYQSVSRLLPPTDGADPHTVLGRPVTSWYTAGVELQPPLVSDPQASVSVTLHTAEQSGVGATQALAPMLRIIGPVAPAPVAEADHPPILIVYCVPAVTATATQLKL